MSRWSVLAALLALACYGSGPGPYSPSQVQLSLWGDRMCSDPVFGQMAMHCCTGEEDEPGHDNCYAFGGLEQDRFICDVELLHCMALADVPPELADGRYRAVRRWGGGSFNYTTHRTRGRP